jgi:hypothetical protein
MNKIKERQWKWKRNQQEKIKENKVKGRQKENNMKKRKIAREKSNYKIKKNM